MFDHVFIKPLLVLTFRAFKVTQGMIAVYAGVLNNEMHLSHGCAIGNILVGYDRVTLVFGKMNSIFTISITNAFLHTLAVSLTSANLLPP